MGAVDDVLEQELTRPIQDLARVVVGLSAEDGLRRELSEHAVRTLVVELACLGVPWAELEMSLQTIRALVMDKIGDEAVEEMQVAHLGTRPPE